MFTSDIKTAGSKSKLRLCCRSCVIPIIRVLIAARDNGDDDSGDEGDDGGDDGGDDDGDDDGDDGGDGLCRRVYCINIPDIHHDQSRTARREWPVH